MYANTEDIRAFVTRKMRVFAVVWNKDLKQFHSICVTIICFCVVHTKFVASDRCWYSKLKAVLIKKLFSIDYVGSNDVRRENYRLGILRSSKRVVFVSNNESRTGVKISVPKNSLFLSMKSTSFF